MLWSRLAARSRKSEPAVSRVLSRAIIHLGQPSPTASSDLPGSPLGTGGADLLLLPYLVLLQAGFAVPRAVASRAVRSYRTFSPLPGLIRRRVPAVYFLWHFPWAHAPQALPGALSEGARTFLCNVQRYSDCLADSDFLGRRILQQSAQADQPIDLRAKQYLAGAGLTTWVGAHCLSSLLRDSR